MPNRGVHATGPTAQDLWRNASLGHRGLDQQRVRDSNCTLLWRVMRTSTVLWSAVRTSTILWCVMRTSTVLWSVVRTTSLGDRHVTYTTSF